MKLTSDLVSTVFPQFTNKELLKEIASKASIKKFEANDIVIDSGMPITFVPLIVKGNLRVLKIDEDSGNELLLYYLKEGETCASSLSCCMTHTESEVEVIAEEDSTVLGIPFILIDEWMDTYSEWRNFIMQTYKKKFDELLETVNSITFTLLDVRLIKYLKELSSVQGNSIIHTSHLEIAGNLNSSREVISRLLKQMEKRNMIKLSRNTIEIISLE